MKILRWLGAGLVAVVAGVLALVGLILCVTLILLPLGIPVLMLARRVFALAGRMVVPRALRHPIDELDKSREAASGTLKKRAKTGARSSADKVQETGKSAVKRGKQGAKRGRKSAKRTARRLRKGS